MGSDEVQLQAGDMLLLCTDGVWHYFVDSELGATLDALEPREACEALIKRARQRAGGHGDNLSLAVLKISAAPPPPPAPPAPRFEFPDWNDMPDTGKPRKR